MNKELTNQKTIKSVPEKRLGSVTRKPGSNKLYVDFRYFGKRIVKSVGLSDTPKNRESVRNFLDQVMRAIEDGTFRFADAFPGASPKELAFFAQREGWDYKPEPQEVLIGKYIQVWLTKIWTNFESETKKRDFKSAVDDWILPFFEDKTFFQFTKVELKQFVATLKHRSGPRAGENLSRSRCNNILLPLKAIWEDAVDEFRWNLPDPFRRLYKILPKKRPRREFQNKRRVFRFDELMVLLDNIKSPYRLPTEFMLRTGAIGSELAGLRKGDIVGDYIYFRNSIVRGKEKTELKTEYRLREFPIGRELRKVLDGAIAQAEGEYVFLTSTGLNFAEGTYRKNGWTPALKRAGLEYCVPYSLRHTFAAWCLAIGMYPNRLVDLMGHGSKKMVYEVYGPYTEGLEDDAEKILSFFGPDFLSRKGEKVLGYAFATSPAG